MPEGHTIHRLASDLARDFRGQRISISSPQGRFTAADRVDGLTFTGAHAIGKHLFIELEQERVHVHLGLFGRFRRARPGPPRPSVRLRIETEALAWELSGPNVCELIDPAEYVALRDRLGADPLSNGPRPRAAWDKVSRSRRSIGALLLDQSILSGIGNVFRAELLFLVGLHPDTRGVDVPKPTFEKLWKLSKQLLERSAKANRIITVQPAERSGRASAGEGEGEVREGRRARRERLHVYGRETCLRCGGDVTRTTSAARTLYFCPRCQPAAPAG